MTVASSPFNARKTDLGALPYTQTFLRVVLGNIKKSLERM